MYIKVKNSNALVLCCMQTRHPPKLESIYLRYRYEIAKFKHVATMYNHCRQNGISCLGYTRAIYSFIYIEPYTVLISHTFRSLFREKGLRRIVSIGFTLIVMHRLFVNATSRRLPRSTLGVVIGWTIQFVLHGAIKLFRLVMSRVVHIFSHYTKKKISLHHASILPIINTQKNVLLQKHVHV